MKSDEIPKLEKSRYHSSVYGRFVPMQVRIRLFRPGLFRPITSSSHCQFVPWMFRQDQDRLLVKRRNDNRSPGPVIGEISP